MDQTPTLPRTPQDGDEFSGQLEQEICDLLAWLNKPGRWAAVQRTEEMETALRGLLSQVELLRDQLIKRDIFSDGEPYRIADALLADIDKARGTVEAAAATPFVPHSINGSDQCLVCGERFPRGASTIGACPGKWMAER